MKISCIIPVLNEAATLEEFLHPLSELRKNGHEIIIVDGNSIDNTISIAKQYCDKVVSSDPCRAQQMNIGADSAMGDVYLFLHADTQLPRNADRIIIDHMKFGKRQWGRFDVTLNNSHIMYRIIEFLMNARSRVTGIATGDQAIFVTKTAFNRISGFENIPLMEDIVFSKALKKLSKPVCLQQRVITSARKWERNGIFRTILLMWKLRLAFACGVAPYKLAKQYYSSN